MSSTITVLHPGQMGAAIACQAARSGHRVLWIPAGRSDRTRGRAATAGLVEAESLIAALGQSSVVLSICPPVAAEDVARQVCETGVFSGIFVDANAISPQRAESLSLQCSEAGLRMVDGAIIGPPPSGSTRARLYLSGGAEAVLQVAGLFADGLVQPRPLDQPVGAASALKMAFASYQKAARTLVGVAHALADRYGVASELINEGTSMAGPLLADREYLTTVAPRAWRWEPELRDVAATLEGAGLPTELALATATVLGKWEAFKDESNLSVEKVLAALQNPA